MSFRGLGHLTTHLGAAFSPGETSLHPKVSELKALLRPSPTRAKVPFNNILQSACCFPSNDSHHYLFIWVLVVCSRERFLSMYVQRFVHQGCFASCTAFA